MIGSKLLRHLKTLIILEVGKSVSIAKTHVGMATVAGSNVAVGLKNPKPPANMTHITSSSDWPPAPEECSENNIVWVDLEMTGLDPDKDHVLEVACLVTDRELNILAEGPDLTIYQPPEVLDNMNEWSIKQHAESGLTSKCQQSVVTLQEAEKQLLQFVRTWAPFKKCPLGGNTIYMDRMFLMKHMPEFEQHMHYRIVDVSSIKELCSRWFPDVYKDQPNKKELSKHRSLDDIKASVGELKFYKKHIFRQPELGEAMGLTWC